MFTIKRTEAERVSQGLRTWLAAEKVRCVLVYRGMVAAAFNFMAYETPQWSGNAASNWNIGVGAEDNSVIFTLKQTQKTAGAYGEHKVVGQSYYGTPSSIKGDPRAVDMAVGRNRDRISAITLQTPVFITNSAAEISGESYIKMLEENPNDYLRAENEPGLMAFRARTFLNGYFARIDGGKEIALKALELGDRANAGALQ